MNFGKTLKKLRVDKNETLHQVAMGTNIDATQLSKFERNVRFPTIEQIYRISKHFNTSMSDLTALVVSNKIINNYGLNDVTSKAINLVSEQFISYNSDSKAKNENQIKKPHK